MTPTRCTGRAPSAGPQAPAPDRPRRARTWAIYLLPALCVTAAGCARAGAQRHAGPQPEFGPHGGVVVSLPGEAGFAEVHLDAPTAIGPRAGDQVVARFYEPDRQMPRRSPVHDVLIALEFPDGPPLPITLAAGAEPGRYESAPAARPYDVDPLVGVLTGNLDGERFEVPFAGR